MPSGTQPHSVPAEEGLGDGQVSLHALVETLRFFLKENSPPGLKYFLQSSGFSVKTHHFGFDMLLPVKAGCEQESRPGSAPTTLRRTHALPTSYAGSEWRN